MLIYEESRRFTSPTTPHMLSLKHYFSLSFSLPLTNTRREIVSPHFRETAELVVRPQIISAIFFATVTDESPVSTRICFVLWAWNPRVAASLVPFQLRKISKTAMPTHMCVPQTTRVIAPIVYFSISCLPRKRNLYFIRIFPHLSIIQPKRKSWKKSRLQDLKGLKFNNQVDTKT